MVCCCGKISLPLGAALSIGTTSITKSLGATRSPTRTLSSLVSLRSFAIVSFSSKIPSPVRALTESVADSSESSSFLGMSLLDAMSDLLYTLIKGTFLSSMRDKISASSGANPFSVSITRTARSVFLKTPLAFSILSCPSSPTSSRPGVSITTTGPAGSSSIDLYTGSVVVPATSDTMAKFCPVTALSKLLLPAFLHPKNAMCFLSEPGVSLSPIFKPLLSHFQYIKKCIARPQIKSSKASGLCG